MRTIKKIIDNLFFNEKIKTKEQYVEWTKYNNIYTYIHKISTKHYNSLKYPIKYINRYVYKKIIGYSQYSIKYNEMNESFVNYVNKYKNKYNLIIKSIKKKYKKVLMKRKNRKPGKKYKICKKCHEFGHYASAVECEYNIHDNLVLIYKIREFVLKIPFFTKKTMIEHLTSFSEKNKLSYNKVNKLYNTIHKSELFNRKMNLEKHFKKIKTIKCEDCDKILYNTNLDSNRRWKDTIVCEMCWGNHEKEINDVWDLIKKQNIYVCNICNISKKINSQRFHFDHKNMFTKSNNISTMVNSGETIENINKEIQKCNILCVSCHHIVSSIETRLGFTNIKTLITKKYRNELISNDELEFEKNKYSVIYEKKMCEVYNILKKNIK